MTLSAYFFRACIVLLCLRAVGADIRAQSGCAGTIDPAFISPLTSGPTAGETFLLAPAEKGVVVSVGDAVVRLDERGAIDPSFSAGTLRRSDRGAIKGLRRDSNGRYLIWGHFDKVNFSPRPGIARLLANGDLDPNFVPANRLWDVDGASLDNNGGYIIAVQTNTVPQAPSASSPSILIRLNSDGSIDSQFTAGAGSDGPVSAIDTQPDGKTLVAGDFKNFSGRASAGLVRLLPNGAIDESFNPEKLIRRITGLKALADGKLLAYSTEGLLVTDPSYPKATNSLVRYNNDGSVDGAFTPPAGSIADAQIQTDGKYLVPGLAASRLLPNGERDPTFKSSARLPSYAGGYIYLGARGSIALGPNDEIYVAGLFWEVNGLGRPWLARLLNDHQPCIALIGFESEFQTVNESAGALSVPILRTGNLNDRVPFQIYSRDSESSYQLLANAAFDPGQSRLVLQLPLRDDRALEPIEGITLVLQAVPTNVAYTPIKVANFRVIDSTSTDTPGSIDPNFDLSEIARDSSRVYSLPNGKVIVGGFFYRSLNDTDYIIRLNADLSLDATFQDSSSAPAGRFASWNDKLYVAVEYGITPTPLRRLNADGSQDATFVPPTFLSPYARNLSELVVQPDGKLIVIGPFTNINGIARLNIARFNSDGSLDTSFDAGETTREYGSLHRLALLKDGTILVGGNFNQFSGVPNNGLVHLSSTGALLPGFVLPGDNDQEVRAIFADPDGGATVFGRFSDDVRYYALRFNAAGQIDPAFAQTPSENFHASDAIHLPDGKFIVILGIEGSSETLVRLMPDGTPDRTFYFPCHTSIYNLALLPGGDILAAGYFQFLNGWPVQKLLRIRGGEYSGPGIFEIEPNVTAREDAGSMKVKIRRLWSTGGAATVRFKTQDLADASPAGVNYVAVDTLVSFADGQSEAEVSIPLINTPQFEHRVDFVGVLEAESAGAGVSKNPSVANLSITDDQPFITLSLHEWYIPVETDAKFDVFVELVGPSNNVASVQVVTDGGAATPGADYEPISTTIELSDSNRRVVAPVRLIDDTIYEPTETVRITLKNPTGAGILGPASVDAPIREFGDRYRILNSEITAIQNDGVVTVQLVRETDWMAQGPARFTYQTEPGTARPGVEYVPQQGEIVFETTDRETKSITIALLPNNIVGPATTFQVRLTPIDAEVGLTNPVATIAVQHPPVVIPAGRADPAFAPVANPGSVYRLITTPQFVYTVGPFQLAPNISAHRFQHDGTYDSTFRPTYYIQRLFPLPDETIVASTVEAGLVRLKSDGSIDPSFQPNFSRQFETLSVESAGNGKLLVSGAVSVHGVSVLQIIRLLPDGQRDPQFGPVTLGRANFGSVQILRQADEKILLYGSFSSVNGIARPGFARLLSDGAIDMSFDPPADIIFGVQQFYLLPDGKLLATGSFRLAPETYATILRFNADGSLDTTFEPPRAANAETTALGVDPQGRVYYHLYYYNQGGIPGHRELVRVLPNGQADPRFSVNLPNGMGLVVTTAGLFSVSYSSTALPLLTRLYSEPPPALAKPELLANNRVAFHFTFPPNSSYILESTTDFVTWTTILTGVSEAGYVRSESDLPSANSQFYRLRAP